MTAFVQKLAAAPGANGSLLDNTLIYYGCSNSAMHNNSNYRSSSAAAKTSACATASFTCSMNAKCHSTTCTSPCSRPSTPPSTASPTARATLTCDPAWLSEPLFHTTFDGRACVTVADSPGIHR